MNAGKNDEETEKGINTKLISGVPGFSIDNVHRMLDLEALNTATERPLLSPRQFGALTDIEIENGAVIYMTGNNLAIIGEQRAPHHAVPHGCRNGAARATAVRQRSDADRAGRSRPLSSPTS